MLRQLRQHRKIYKLTTKVIFFTNRCKLFRSTLNLMPRKKTAKMFEKRIVNAVVEKIFVRTSETVNKCIRDLSNIWQHYNTKCHWLLRLNFRGLVNQTPSLNHNNIQTCHEKLI